MTEFWLKPIRKSSIHPRPEGHGYFNNTIICRTKIIHVKNSFLFTSAFFKISTFFQKILINIYRNNITCTDHFLNFSLAHGFTFANYFVIWQREELF